MSQAAVADGAAAQTAAARDPEQSGLSAQWMSRGLGVTNSWLYAVPFCGPFVDAAELEQRCVHFQQGEWLHLLRRSGSGPPRSW